MRKGKLLSITAIALLVLQMFTMLSIVTASGNVNPEIYAPNFLFKGSHPYDIPDWYTAEFAQGTEFTIPYTFTLPVTLSDGLHDSFTFPENCKAEFQTDANVTVREGYSVEFQKSSRLVIPDTCSILINKSGKIEVPATSLYVWAGTWIEFLESEHSDPAHVGFSGGRYVIFKECADVRLPNDTVIEFDNGSIRFRTEARFTLTDGKIYVDGYGTYIPSNGTNIVVAAGTVMHFIPGATSPRLKVLKDPEEIHFEENTKVKWIEYTEVFINHGTWVRFLEEKHEIQFKEKQGTTLHFPEEGGIIQGFVPGGTQIHFVDDTGVIFTPGEPKIVTIKAGSGVHFRKTITLDFQNDPSYPAVFKLETGAWFSESTKMEIDNAEDVEDPTELMFYKCGNATFQPCTYLTFDPQEKFEFPTSSKINFPANKTVEFPTSSRVEFQEGADVKLENCSKVNFEEGAIIEFPEEATDVEFQYCSKVVFERFKNIKFPASANVTFQEYNKVNFPKCTTIEVRVPYSGPWPELMFQKSSKINFTETVDHLGFPADKVLEFQNGSMIDLPQSTKMWFYNGSLIRFKNDTVVEIHGSFNDTLSLWWDTVRFPKDTTIKIIGDTWIHFINPETTYIEFAGDSLVSFDEEASISVHQYSAMHFVEEFPLTFLENTKIHFEEDSGVYFPQDVAIHFVTGSTIQFILSAGVHFDEDVTLPEIEAGTWVYFERESGVHFGKWCGTRVTFLADSNVNFIKPTQVTFTEYGNSTWTFDADSQVKFQNCTYVDFPQDIPIQFKQCANVSIAEPDYAWVDFETCSNVTFYQCANIILPVCKDIDFYGPGAIKWLTSAVVEVRETEGSALTIGRHDVAQNDVWTFEEGSRVKIHVKEAEEEIHVESKIMIHFQEPAKLKIKKDSVMHFPDELTTVTLEKPAKLHFLKRSGVHFPQETTVTFQKESGVHFLTDTTVTFEGEPKTYNENDEVTYHASNYVKFLNSANATFTNSSKVNFPECTYLGIEKDANITFRSCSTIELPGNKTYTFGQWGRIHFLLPTMFRITDPSTPSATIIWANGTYTTVAYNTWYWVPTSTKLLFNATATVEFSQDTKIHFVKDTSVYFNYDTQIHFNTESAVHFENNKTIHFVYDTVVHFKNDATVIFNVTSKVVEPVPIEVHVKRLTLKFDEDTTLKLKGCLHFEETSKVRFLNQTLIHLETPSTIKFQPCAWVHFPTDTHVTPYISTGAGNYVWLNLTVYDGDYDWPSNIAVNDSRFVEETSLRTYAGVDPYGNGGTYLFYFRNNSNLDALSCTYLPVKFTAYDKYYNASDPVKSTYFSTADIWMKLDLTAPTVDIDVYRSFEAKKIDIHVKVNDKYLQYEQSYVYVNGTEAAPSPERAEYLGRAPCWRNCTTFIYEADAPLSPGTINITAVIVDGAWPTHHTTTYTEFFTYTTGPEFSVTKTDILGGITLENFATSSNIEVVGYDVVINGSDNYISNETLYSSTLTMIIPFEPDIAAYAFNGRLILDLTAHSGETLSIDVTAKDWNGKESAPVHFTTTVAAGKFHIIELQEGWNLISLPLIPPTGKIATATLFGNKPQIVYWYNATSGAWLWYMYGVPSSTLDWIYDGEGYWVQMNSYNILIVEGFEMPPPGMGLPPTYPVITGWNLKGFKSTTPMLASEYLASLKTVAGQWKVYQVYGFNTQTQTFETLFIRDAVDNIIEPGQGYWIYMLEPGDIVPP